MAEFTSVKPISDNIRAAEEILSLFKSIYSTCKAVEQILNRYNTDPVFKAEADHLFTVEQIAELGVMIADVTSFRTNWETNHAGALVNYIPAPPAH